MPTEIGREWNGWRVAANAFMSNSATVLKWPIGIIIFSMTPALLMSIIDVASSVSGNWIEFASLTIGIIMYAAIRHIFLGERSWTSTFEVLHHELIHAFLALCCFCTVEEIKASRCSGGHVKYGGQGNWLITIGPYFLPLLPLIIACASTLIAEPFSYFVIALTGFSMGFYYFSLQDDFHMNQTDLKKVGFPFSVIFLIPANIMAILLVTLISINGADGFGIWFEAIWTNTYDLVFFRLS